MATDTDTLTPPTGTLTADAVERMTLAEIEALTDAALERVMDREREDLIALSYIDPDDDGDWDEYSHLYDVDEYRHHQEGAARQRARRAAEDAAYMGRPAPATPTLLIEQRAMPPRRKTVADRRVDLSVGIDAVAGMLADTIEAWRPDGSQPVVWDADGETPRIRVAAAIRRAVAGERRVPIAHVDDDPEAHVGGLRIEVTVDLPESAG